MVCDGIMRKPRLSFLGAGLSPGIVEIPVLQQANLAGSPLDTTRDYIGGANNGKVSYNSGEPAGKVALYLRKVFMSKSKTPSRTAYRDAVDGQFITKREAERNPRESVKEKVPLPTPPKRGK